MMIDKMPLLQSKARQKGYDLTPPTDEGDDEDNRINEFSSKIAEAQSNIKFIDLKNDQLLEAKGEVENATGNEQQTAVSEKINRIVDEVQGRQNKMKTTIDELDEMVKAAKEDDKDGNKTETRVKQNLFGAMIKKYQSTCLRFQTLESEIKSIMQTKIVRSAEIALGRRLEDQEKIEVLNEPQTVQKLYENKLKGAAHVKLQNAVADLEDRHKDIKNLEKSILQVHNLIIELSKLVQLQGEMIDNIEVNIKTAKDYVQSAEKDIIQSKKNLQSARKKKIIILIIVVVVLAIIIIPIVLKLK